MAQETASTIELPPPGALAAVLAEASRERKFWAEHYAEFREKYPDKFVAVIGREVVATGDTLQCLEAEMAAKGHHFGPGTWMEHFPVEPRLLIL